MTRLALIPVLAATAMVLSGCVTIVAPSPGPEKSEAPPVAEELDNRTDVSCVPGEDLLLNNPSTLYTISGPCESVTVEGTDLIVRGEQIDLLVLRGDRNAIEAVEIGAVEISGQANEVTAGAIGRVGIQGDRNTVSSDEAINDTDVSGNDNTVD